MLSDDPQIPLRSCCLPHLPKNRVLFFKLIILHLSIPRPQAPTVVFWDPKRKKEEENVHCNPCYSSVKLIIYELPVPGQYG